MVVEMKIPAIHSSRWVHLVVVSIAIIYAAATLFYSILWMVDARAKSQLPAVELGFDTDFIKAKSVQSVKKRLSGKSGREGRIAQG